MVRGSMPAVTHGLNDGREVPFYKKTGNQLAMINVKKTATSSGLRSEFPNTASSAGTNFNLNALHASLTTGKGIHLVNNAMNRRNWPANPL